MPSLFCVMRKREWWLFSLLNILLQRAGLIIAFYHFPLYSSPSSINYLNIFRLQSERNFSKSPDILVTFSSITSNPYNVVTLVPEMQPDPKKKEKMLIELVNHYSTLTTAQACLHLLQ